MTEKDNFFDDFAKNANSSDQPGDDKTNDINAPIDLGGEPETTEGINLDDIIDTKAESSATDDLLGDIDVKSEPAQEPIAGEVVEQTEIAPAANQAVNLAAKPGSGVGAAHGRKVEVDKRAQEIFRGMWASIFYSGKTTGKTVLITSATRREGASTIAAGLALVGDGNVALVDFNLRAPAIDKSLNLRKSPGTGDAIAGKTDLTSCAQRVNGKLDVFTIGDMGPHSLRALEAAAVEDFFAKLRENYDYIIVDAACANHYPDAQVLGAVLKEAVIVIDSDQTPREAVAQAKKRIEDGGGKVAGIIMNKRTFPIPNFLYRRV